VQIHDFMANKTEDELALASFILRISILHTTEVNSTPEKLTSLLS
jgi:hypothetical protein